MGRGVKCRQGFRVWVRGVAYGQSCRAKECGVGKGVVFEHGCRAWLRPLSVGREVLSWKKCSVWVRVYDVG